MLSILRAKCGNWLDSDKKLKKLAVSLHYWLFKHKSWDNVLSLNNKDKFTEIYRNNLWNNEESLSGGGSTLKRTSKIRSKLPDLVREKAIRSVCDAGCGDFNWMKSVNADNITYIGIDIVKDMIASNKEKYERGNISFLELDIICDDLPTVDLILCREVLFHLSFKEIGAAIVNFKKSKSTFLLATHFPYLLENIDISSGRCRGLNFQIAPLNFPAPIEIIEEDISDHCLSLWKLDDIDPDRFG